MHRLDALEHRGRRRPEGGLEQPAVGDALLQRVGDRARLLVDLLEHEVPVLALLGGIGGQLALVDRTLGAVAVAIDDAHAAAPDLRDVALVAGT